LVAVEHTEEFRTRVADGYDRAIKLKPEIYVCNASNGSSEFKL
jgi:galactokinase